MKISKKNSEKFFNSIKDFIVNELKGEGGRTNFDHNRYEYVINTIVGKMEVVVYSDQYVNSCYAIFCKFYDVDKAIKKFDCNRFSGKYNYLSGNRNVDKAIDWVKHHLEVTQEVVKQ